MEETIAKWCGWLTNYFQSSFAMDDYYKVDWDAVDCGIEAADFDFEVLDIQQFTPFSIEQPGVPFLHTLKQRLAPSNSFVIDGTVFDNGNKFMIDLCYHTICSRDNVYKKNIAFHLNPRLPMNCVVRNSFIDEAWGPEEVRTFRRNPLKRGCNFIIELFVSPKEYLVAINGSHFCSFAHRVPFTEVTTIEINGDISLNKVEFTSSKYYPAIDFNNNAPTSKILEVPHMKSLTKSLSLPSTVVLEGSVYLLPFNFFVNLQSGAYVYPHPMIPFHMSVRWRPSQEDFIVLNSWTDGKWGSEVVLPMCDLFQPGSEFVVKIEISHLGYQVIVNDFPLPVFYHRIQAELVDAVFVQGDVILRRVEVV